MAELDRTQLLIVVLLTFFLCGISFFFGRWSRDDPSQPFRSLRMPTADHEKDEEEYTFYEATTQSEESYAPEAVPQPQPMPRENQLKVREGANSRVHSMSYAIQLLATADHEKAQLLATTFKHDDYPAFLMTTDRSGRPPLYRVRIGFYQSKTLAEDIAENLRAKGHSTWIVAESSQKRPPAQSQH